MADDRKSFGKIIIGKLQYNKLQILECQLSNSYADKKIKVNGIILVFEWNSCWYRLNLKRHIICRIQVNDNFAFITVLNITFYF